MRNMIKVLEYRRMIAQWESNLIKLESERDRIDAQINNLRDLIAGAEQANGNRVTRSRGAAHRRPRKQVRRGGITDAIRKSLSTPGTQLTPTEFRERLLRMKFKNDRNLLPMIHNALHRLEERGEAKKVHPGDRKSPYIAVR
jgi:hypothetical protein